MDKLLIIDDSGEIRKQLKWGLGKEYRVLLAENVESAMDLFRTHRPQVVTLDLGLPPDADGVTEGFRCLDDLLTLQPATKVIVLSGNEERVNALQAVHCGAYDFYQKPIVLDELKVILSRAFHLAALEAEYRRLQSSVYGAAQSVHGILGQCPRMEAIFQTIRKVAAADIPVMVLGESGTGKEMVARAIHIQSLHKDGPFIPINCGAIPEQLLESELFGHEKGAFTGAQTRVQGKVEFAQGGTLFLDEIGEMPALLQVKILRFLQEKIIQRVGGRENIAVDARIIAATNVNIEEAIKDGAFREDLYYRLGVISCSLPPLRERGDDIDLLANYFLLRFSGEFHKKLRGFSAASMATLRDYGWPGNVRELENKIKRAVVMADTAIVEPRDLGFEAGQQPDPVAAGSPPRELNVSGLTLKEAKSRVERALLISSIEQNRGNIVKTAEALRVSRPTLYDLLKKHGLHSPVE